MKQTLGALFAALILAPPRICFTDIYHNVQFSKSTLLRSLSFLWVCIAMAACSNRPEATPIDDTPYIFPDYKEVVIPPNIAPLNFSVIGAEKIEVTLTHNEETLGSFTGKNRIEIPLGKWKQITATAAGSQIDLSVEALSKTEKRWIKYKPFAIYISTDEIDPYLAYRLIEPTYELWSKMGIYQRDITSFDEKPLFENTLSDNSCVNCHSFANYSGEKFLFHSRQSHGGTVFADGKQTHKVNLKPNAEAMAAVYPHWHPSGKYVAFSTNDTRQAFHTYDPDRVSVYDLRSNLVVYDVAGNQLKTDDRFASDSVLETFPAWSPDGKWLYFCRATTRNLPFEYKQLKYGIYKVAFDAERGILADSVACVVNEEETGKTALFPRISPDGRFLLYTEADCGTFPIWHREADLRMVDLQTGAIHDLAAVNSSETESYHAWSSSGRWIVFSSRRIDGLYTRPYIAHCNAEGTVSKPFLLPQKDSRFYNYLLKSYNIPEFTTTPVSISPYELEQVVKSTPENATISRMNN